MLDGFRSHHAARIAVALAAAWALLLTGGWEPAAAGVSKGGPPAPRAWTSRVIGLHATNAVLVGFVNPRGQLTTWFFEWGKTARYGNAPELNEEELTGSRNDEVAEGLTRLQPGTVYHYRLVAHSRGGTSYGKDKTFRTPRR
jgi:hypothetical protein